MKNVKDIVNYIEPRIEWIGLCYNNHNNLMDYNMRLNNEGNVTNARTYIENRFGPISSDNFATILMTLIDK